MHDPRSLTLARNLQKRVNPALVLLFGSRARGDWKKGSDIDFMVVDDEPLSRELNDELTWAMEEEAQQLYGRRVSVQVFGFSWEEFLWARRAPMHVAGGAQREGIMATGEPMPPIQQDNPWPAVQLHLRVAQDSLHAALVNEGVDEFKTSGLSAHHALENALKAYASVLGQTYDMTHSLIQMVRKIQAKEKEISLPDAEWLNKMTQLREKGPYQADFELFLPAEEIVTMVQALCGQIAARVLYLAHKKPDQVGYVHWQTNRPLGGLEDVELKEFDRERQMKQERQEGLVAGKSLALRESLLAVAYRLFSANQIAELTQILDESPVEDWPTITDVLNMGIDSHDQQ